MEFLIKLYIDLPFDPEILLVGNYLGEMKTYLHKKTYIGMFIGALIPIAIKKIKTGNNINVHQQENYKQTAVYLHKRIQFINK